MTEDFRGDTRSGIERLIGGRPMSVLIKLVLISLLVGFVMTVFGFDAADVVRSALDMVRDVLRDGSGLIGRLGAYILTGAAIVVPVWLILRLMRAR